MEKTYRILHIFSGYGGGISSLILNLAENKIDNFIFDAMSFSFNGGEDFVNLIKKMGGVCYTMPRPRLDGVKAFNKYVNEIMCSNRYDAVHCHITGWSALPFIKNARRNGIKIIVLHAHTTTYDRKLDRVPFVLNIDRKINYKYADAFFTCSDLAAKYIYGERYLEKRSAFLVPNGINEEKYSDKITFVDDENYRQEFALKGDEKIILHVGRFSRQKNHDFILDIAKSLKETNVAYRMLLVGNGERLEEMKKKASEMQLDNVIFLNRRSDIGKLMQFADLMILPSFYEGLPTVAVECEASGCPALLADTITRQCDLNLGLITFMPIDNADVWADAIARENRNHLPISECIDTIRKKGFTAKESSRLYCRKLEELING